MTIARAIYHWYCTCCVKHLVKVSLARHLQTQLLESDLMRMAAASDTGAVHALCTSSVA